MMRAHLRRPVPLPRHVRTQEVEFFDAALDAVPENFLHQKLSGAALGQLFIIGRLEQVVSTVDEQPILKGDGAALEAKKKQRKLARVRRTSPKLGIEPAPRATLGDRGTAFAFPARALQRESLLQFPLQIRSPAQ